MQIRNAHNEDDQMKAGACEHLAEMILELQQMALRLGASDVSVHLQAAYLETRILVQGDAGRQR